MTSPFFYPFLSLSDHCVVMESLSLEFIQTDHCGSSFRKLKLTIVQNLNFLNGTVILAFGDYSLDKSTWNSDKLSWV